MIKNKKSMEVRENFLYTRLKGALSSNNNVNLND